MKTYLPKQKELERKWYIIDMTEKTLGRVATKIADVLRGKHKATYTPHLDTGDYVVVTNAEKIKLSGKKLQKKEYYHHSRYPGGLRKTTPKKLIAEKKAEKIIFEAVSGMLPRNRTKKITLQRLKIFKGSTHPHEAQKPEPLNI